MQAGHWRHAHQTPCSRAVSRHHGVAERLFGRIDSILSQDAHYRDPCLERRLARRGSDATGQEVHAAQPGCRFEVLDESCLADAGLTADPHDGSASLRECFHISVEIALLAQASEEHSGISP